MKNKIITTLAALAVAFTLGSTAKADPITGAIAFSGTPKFINGNTAVSFSNISINGGNGDFAGVTADANSIVFSNITFNPLVLPSANIWQFTDDGVLYSFKASTISFTSPPTQPIWDFGGKGLFSIGNSDSGFTPTLGTWSISFSQNGILSFEATAGTGIPDGGTTALLVGLGLLAVGLYARKAKLAKS
jgi:hypothetical protein